MSDEHAGRRLKCKECGELLTMPQNTPSSSDAFMNALDAAADETSVYQPPAADRLPPRTVRSKTTTQNESSGKRSKLTAQQVYLIQGLTAGFIAGAITNLVLEIFNFTGWPDLALNTVLGTVTGTMFGGAVMWSAGKFNSAFVGYVTGVFVMVPMTALEGFIVSLLGFEILPLPYYFVIGVPRGIFCAWVIFGMAKEIHVEEV